MTDDGRTHWPACYRERGHHECAVDEVDRLRAALATIAAIPAFPMRDVARRALGIVDDPAPRSTADLRAALAEREP